MRDLLIRERTTGDPTTATSTTAELTTAEARTRTRGPVICKNGDFTLRFTVIDPHLIRVEQIAGGQRFVDAQTLFAIERPRAPPPFATQDDGERLVIDTGPIRLELRRDGLPLGVTNLRADIRDGDRSFHWNGSTKNDHNLGGTLTTLDDLKGAIPLEDGLLSRDGWFLLDDSKSALLEGDWMRSRAREEAGTDWYFFGYGTRYPAALESLGHISGTVPMPRARSLGSWYSRYWPYSSTEYDDIVREYEHRDFPLDVLVQDMDWMDNSIHPNRWTGFTYNRSLIPDPAAFNAGLHRESLSTALNLHPHGGVAPGEEGYEAFMRAIGKDPSTKETVQFDAGNRDLMNAFFEHVLAPIIDRHVDWFWLDWQTQHGQPAHTPSVPAMKNLPWLNHLLYKFTANEFPSSASSRQHDASHDPRGQNLTRYGGWGDHRYPIHFSGDYDSGWPALQFQVPFTSSSGNRGVFFWSHDIGGHSGARNPESYARWVQFGALSASLRVHSARDMNLDRRPWSYGPEVEESARRAYWLRSQLFPYIYSSAWASHQTMLPLLRPMYLEDSNEEQAYWNPQQYMLGHDLLATPITSPGIGPGKVSSQIAWFPEGQWYAWDTGERYDGGTRTLVSADLNEVPLFARGGVPIPTSKAVQRMATKPLEELVVRTFPGKDGQDGRTELHEDDGRTRAYDGGSFSTTEITSRRRDQTTTLEVKASVGAFSDQPSERTYRFEFPATQPASSARVDGVEVSFEYDAQQRMNIVTVPSRNIRLAVEVEIDAEEIDPAVSRRKALAHHLTGLGVVPNLGREAGELPHPRLEVAALASALASSGGVADKAFEQLLRTFGIGFSVRADGPYLFSPQGLQVLETFHHHEDLSVEGVLVTVEDISKGARELRIERNIPKEDSGKTRLGLPPFLPAFHDDVRVVSMHFQVEGVPVTLQRIVSKADDVGAAVDGAVDPAIWIRGTQHADRWRVGHPVDNGSGTIRAHRWGSGVVQDFDGGDYGPTICMHRDSTDEAHLLRGFIRDLYIRSNGIESLGYPVGDEAEVDGIKLQRFERGSIVEDAPQSGGFHITR